MDGRRVLLVEDDLVSASALQAILVRRGYQVVHAATVAQAMASLGPPPPDTVILDLMLPDGDGAAVLAHLRAANAPCRVIVTSAVHDTSRLEAVQALAPDVMLQKPIDLVGLFRALKPAN